MVYALAAFLMLTVSDITLVRVVDGDTIRVDLPCDIALVCKNQPLRIIGLDTPEIRGKCSLERDKARSAKARLQTLLAGDMAVTLEGKDRYGRLLARVTSDGRDVADILIQEKLARAYAGGKRQGWCQQP